MNEIAYTLGSTSIYWSGIVIALAIAACFLLSYALFTACGGRSSALLLLLPLALCFSVLLSRLFHFDCHIEQYESLWKALTDYSSGGYCMPGVLLGSSLAVLLVWKLGFTGNVRRLFDCLAPGAALGIALIRLSNVFTSSDRSKIIISNPKWQFAPLAAGVPLASGGTEYRFATFYAQTFLMLLLFVLLLVFFMKKRRAPMKAGQPRDGNVALLFLSWYSAIELVADSTRYDASFLRINGFVSLGQILAAFSLLAVLIVYTVRSKRAGSKKALRVWLWIGFWLTIACTGVLEYLVQRHGNWYLFCYGCMSLSCLATALINLTMYRSVREK